jgi:hypothetical protein
LTKTEQDGDQDRGLQKRALHDLRANLFDMSSISAS